MDKRARVNARRAVGAIVGLVALVGGQHAASASVRAVTGSAYGYRAYGITLFGGVQPDKGPTPSVALASNASNSPQAAPAAMGTVVYGPAYLFTSDAISVTSAGNLGSNGLVHSTATLTNVDKSVTQPTVTGSEILTADSIGSSCQASESSGASGSTTIANGTLRTDSGLDVNGDGDFTDAGEHGEVYVTLPTSPAPNTTYSGHIHLGTSTDYWVLVFNEQVTNPDGSLTVNAVHEYFGHKLVSGQIIEDAPYAQGGSILHGHMILARSVCGVTTT